MPSGGQIVLFRFPQTSLAEGKLRPALVPGQLPGPYDDWLICMLSTQLRHYIPDFDELMLTDDDDFESSGLKSASVIRVGRLAVVQGDLLVGATGAIASERLQRIKVRLVAWLRQA